MQVPSTAGMSHEGSPAPALLDFDATLSSFTPRIRAACRRYRGRQVHQDDLYQAAALALWRSTQSFDPSDGTPFEHYASRAIRRAVAREAKRELRHWDGRIEVLQGDPDDDRDLDVAATPPHGGSAGGGPPNDECFDRVLLEHMREWAAKLPDGLLRQLYELRRVRGLTQAETAFEMRVSQQRVSYLEHRLLRLSRAAA
jgi:RNA polymerase sigma factor (sigma-70 family)